MRTRLPLAASFAGLLVFAAPAPAQAVPSAPDLIVSVRKDRVGADLVSIGVRKADYPPDLLRSQILALGQRLGVEARGVMVRQESFRPGDASATVLKGSCGVDGLIDRSTGRLSIVPIAQAFAGAPEPYTVRRMLVSFDGERPGKRTVAWHRAGRTSDLAFTGRPIGSSIEYDVQLLSQDPARLVVNENDGSPVKAPAAPPARGSDPLTIALFVLAAVAAGALVYCLLLLLGRRPARS